jgi:hypothetical protein
MALPDAFLVEIPRSSLRSGSVGDRSPASMRRTSKAFGSSLDIEPVRLDA